MAITADSVIVELQAKIDKYERDMKRAANTTDKVTQDQRRDIQRLEKQIEQSTGAAGRAAGRLAGALAGVFSIREAGRLIDNFTRIQNQLRVTGLEGEALAEVQKRLRAIGAEYGTDLEALTNVFNRASLAQKELGASTEDIIRLNEIVAAGLKVTGASAEQSRGALLQLSQSLGQDIVRAEEFNSILEGALPIAQAAARGIERFGGSVSALRGEIIKGKVSSREFFEGILRGGADTIAQAESATLTLSGAFTVLRNELSLYVGEASKTNGVTEAISSAIRSLAENIDTVATALAVIATVMGGRYVAGMVAAARATAATSGVIFAMQARAIGAATTMEALAFASRSAGASMLAAFGGPVGLAVTALALGITYLATEVETTAQLAERLKGETSELADETDRLVARMKEAGVAVDGLGGEAENATIRVDGLKTSMELATGAAVNMFNTLERLGVAQDAAELRQIRAQREAIQNPSLANGPGALGQLVRNAFDSESDNEAVRALNAREAEIDRKWAARSRAVEAGISIEEENNKIATAEVADAKKTKEKKRTGPSDEDIAVRAEEELARLRLEEIQAQLDLVDNIDERARLQTELLNAEGDARRQQIQNDKYFTQEQKNAQLAVIDSLYGRTREVGSGVITPNDGLFAQQIQREFNDRASEQDRDMLAMREDVLRSQSRLATTLEERRFLEEGALAISQEIERQLLEQAIAEGKIADAATARALLGERQASESEGQRRQNMGERERYVFDLRNRDINQAIEGIEVGGLEKLNDELADAVLGAKSLGDAFGNVAKQIVNDLARIAIQQSVIKPLAESLFGGTGGGGGFFGSIIGAIAGRASGGHVQAGKLYKINESGPELFQPAQSGKIYPTGAMNDRMRDNGNRPVIVQQSFTLDARYGITTPQLLSHVNQVASQKAAQAGQAAYQASPARTAKLQSLGT